MQRFMACALFGIVAFGQTQVQHNSSVSDVEVTLTMENPEAILGGPIIALLIMKNVRLSFSEDLLDPDGVLSVTTSEGAVLARTPKYERWARMSPFRGTHSVAPGTTQVVPIQLSERFEIQKPGRYTLKYNTLQTDFEVFEPSHQALRRGPETALQTLARAFPAEFRKASIQFERQEISITQGEPVSVNLLTTNVTDHDVKMDVCGTGDRTFWMSVLGPSGDRKDVFSSSGRIPPLCAGLEAVMKPAEILPELVILGQWVRFEEVGTYRVALYRPEAADPAVMTVHVALKDPQKLEEIAARLAKDRSTWNSFTALSTMPPEIAIRYLRRNETSPDAAIDALRLIDSEDAVRAIGEFAVGQASDAEHARSALRELKLHGKSEMIRKVAAQVLPE